MPLGNTCFLNVVFCSLRVDDKLPAAKGLLLKRLLSILRHIRRNASTSRRSCTNLAICAGTNLMSPPQEDLLLLLLLEAVLEGMEKVRCLEQPPAAFQAHHSLEPQTSLPASSLQQKLLGCLPARAAPQPQPAFCREPRGSSGKGCSTPFQPPALKARLSRVQVKGLLDFLVERETLGNLWGQDVWPFHSLR